MKKNIIYIISYFIAIIVLLFLLLAFRQVFFVMLLLPLIILPVLSIYSQLKAIRSLNISLSCESESVEESNPLCMRIDVAAKNFLPILNTEVVFQYENLFFPNEHEYRVCVPILPHRTNSIKVSLDTAHPGLIRFHLVSIRLTDLLCLNTKELLLTNSCSIPVLPAIINVPTSLPANSYDGMEEFVEFDNKGNMSSEIKEIREYRPGDRLQRIHWKLSAKLDDLFVKEMEQTSSISILLLPEMTRDKLHNTISTLYSLAHLLLVTEDRFQICLYNTTVCEFNYYLITDESNLYDTFIQLCYLPLYDEDMLAMTDYTASSQKNGILVHIQGEDVTIQEYT